MIRNLSARRLLAALAIVLVAMTGALALNGPTVAAAPAPVSVVAPVQSDDAAGVVDAPAWDLVAYSDCPAGQSCLWTGENGVGTRKNLAFSNYDPPQTCHTLTFQPVGGYHSAKGGYGSGYALALFTDSSCNNFLALLYFGQTWSSGLYRPNSLMII